MEQPFSKSELPGSAPPPGYGPPLGYPPYGYGTPPGYPPPGYAYGPLPHYSPPGYAPPGFGHPPPGYGHPPPGYGSPPMPGVEPGRFVGLIKSFNANNGPADVSGSDGKSAGRGRKKRQGRAKNKAKAKAAPTNAPTAAAEASTEAASGSNGCPKLKELKVVGTEWTFALRSRYQSESPHKLGEGGFAKVAKCRDGDCRENETPWVAIKQICVAKPSSKVDLLSKSFLKGTLRELRILSCKQLRHPNIIEMLDVYRNKDTEFYMVFELMDSNLDSAISAKKKTGTPFTEKQTKTVFFNIICGLDCLHGSGVIHRDLKPENILVKGHLGDAESSVKIADFNCARVGEQNTEYGSLSYIYEVGKKVLGEVSGAGTLWYKSPEELLFGDFHCTGVDVWSLGCICCEFINGEPLFPAASKRCRSAVDQRSICTTKCDDRRSQIRKIFKVLRFPPDADPVKGTINGRSIRSSQREHFFSLEGHCGTGFSLHVLSKCTSSPWIQGISDMVGRMLDFNPKSRNSAKQCLQEPCFFDADQDPLPYLMLNYNLQKDAVKLQPLDCSLADSGHTEAALRDLIDAEVEAFVGRDTGVSLGYPLSTVI